MAVAADFINSGSVSGLLSVRCDAGVYQCQKLLMILLCLRIQLKGFWVLLFFSPLLTCASGVGLFVHCAVSHISVIPRLFPHLSLMHLTGTSRVSCCVKIISKAHAQEYPFIIFFVYLFFLLLLNFLAELITLY